MPSFENSCKTEAWTDVGNEIFTIRFRTGIMGIELNREKKVIETEKSDFISTNFCSSTSLLVVLAILIVVVKSIAVTVAAVHFNFVILIFGTLTQCLHLTCHT